MAIIKALFGRIWPYIAAFGVLVAAVIGIRQAGKAAGKQEAQAKQAQADIKGMNDARDAREEIDALDDDSVRDRARQRMRNNTR